VSGFPAAPVSLARHRFEDCCSHGAALFRWRFSRTNLEGYVERMAPHDPACAKTAEALASRRNQSSLAMISCRTRELGQCSSCLPSQPDC